MNRVEFMETLSRLLQDIPEEDRIDALKYYNDYFDDAGSENEQNVIEELESPESGNVSASLKAQNASSGKDHSESDENENNSANSQDAWKRREKKLKFSFKEQREFDTIDEEIEVLEQKIADLDSEMMKSATNSVKLGELMVKKDETEKALEEKMDRWVYLNDLNERILNGE